MEHPVSWIVLTPLIGLVIVGFLRHVEAIRWATLGVTVLTLGLAVGLWAGFDYTAGGLQFVDRVEWIPPFNIQYAVGVDGISLPLVLLTAFLVPLCVLGSWRSIATNVKAFMMLILLAEGAVVGVFTALDAILFFLFWEITMIPAYFMIAFWGGPNRIQAAIKFVLFSLTGSLLLLVGFEIWVEPIFQTGMPGPRVPLTLLATLAVVPLLARRAYPLAALTIMCTAMVAVGMVGDPEQSTFVLGLGLFVGIYSLAAYATTRHAIIGAAVVFLFSGLAINAVSRAAGAVVYEVRRQFKDKPGIMDGSERPEYGRVVDICTRDSLRELATPGLLAVLAPIAVGFGLGVGPLAGYLAGAIATGTLMAIFLANSGGAWDNSKKLVEDGYHGGKGSEAHAATVIGDTVGDPFKDTAGPAINPLLKVMNLVSVLIAPAVVYFAVGDAANPAVRIGIAVIALAVIVGAVVISKRRSTAIADEPADDKTINGAPA